MRAPDARTPPAAAPARACASLLPRSPPLRRSLYLCWGPRRAAKHTDEQLACTSMPVPQEPLHRRRLRAISADVTASAAAPRGPAPPSATDTKTVALVATTIWRSAHAQHIGDRFGMGYPRDGAWHRPRFKLVSMYVDQQPAGALSPSLSRLAPLSPSLSSQVAVCRCVFIADSVCVGDKPDLAPLRAEEFGAEIYPSIAAALRRGVQRARAHKRTHACARAHAHLYPLHSCTHEKAN